MTHPQLRHIRVGEEWRALYGRIGAVFVSVVIGPEAQVDPHRFRRAVTAATRRLAEIEQ